MKTSESHNATWILVADGSRARIFQYLGPKRVPEIVEHGEFEHPNEPSRDIARAKRGRVFHSADGTRSAMERPTDPHTFEKTRFMAQLADILEEQRMQNRFDRLIVIAPPKALGDFRKLCSAKVLALVDSEIAKDLTKIDHHDLPKHLQSVLNIDV